MLTLHPRLYAELQEVWIGLQELSIGDRLDILALITELHPDNFTTETPEEPQVRILGVSYNRPDARPAYRMRVAGYEEGPMYGWFVCDTNGTR